MSESTEKNVSAVDLSDQIVFPTEAHEPQINPETMILFGKEKCGKTSALAQLPDTLIIDTEQGTNFVKVTSLKVPQDIGPVGKMNWLKKVARKLREEENPYKYIAIDTLTEVDEWSEWSGTYRYMMSPQGKSFNRVKDKYGNPIKDGEILDPDSDEYQSVHTIPEGYGYRWSRNEMMDVFKLFTHIPGVECVIFVCHIEDKYLAFKDNTESVKEEQLALTGKIKKMLPRKVDAIGYVYNNKGTINVNFASSEEKVGGGRAQHLRGYNGPLDWSKVFIK